MKCCTETLHRREVVLVASPSCLCRSEGLFVAERLQHEALVRELASEFNVTLSVQSSSKAILDSVFKLRTTKQAKRIKCNFQTNRYTQPLLNQAIPVDVKIIHLLRSRYRCRRSSSFAAWTSVGVWLGLATECRFNVNMSRRSWCILKFCHCQSGTCLCLTFRSCLIILYFLRHFIVMTETFPVTQAPIKVARIVQQTHIFNKRYDVFFPFGKCCSCIKQ